AKSRSGSSKGQGKEGKGKGKAKGQSGLNRVDGTKIQKLLSKRLKRLLQGTNSSGGTSMVQATQLAIETLNFLRQQQVVAFMKSHKPSRKGCGISSGAGTLEAPPLSWELPGDSGGFPFGVFLKLDFLDVARAAARCGAYCSALLYAEFWAEKQLGTPAACLATSQSDRCNEMHELLVQVFSCLMEPDSMHGTITPGASTALQVAAYAHSGDWYETLLANDRLAQLDASRGRNPHSFAEVAQSLRNMGLWHVLRYYTKGVQDDGLMQAHAAQAQLLTDLPGYQFEIGWRAMEWDGHLLGQVMGNGWGQQGGHGSGQGGASTRTLQEYIYRSLMALRQRNWSVFDAAWTEARIKVAAAINAGISYEGGKDLYLSLT
ncbi:unnamed protein product, partial [Chrysoparadoxa australica]